LGTASQPGFGRLPAIVVGNKTGDGLVDIVAGGIK
jgi:hypothetical protein